VILLRYFAREIFVTMFAVAGIVLIISMGWRFSGYLENAAAGLMSREVLFSLMAYRLPGFLELIIPVSFFLSIMLVHGRLHVDSEMIVLQACGMSTGRLIQMTLLTAAAVMIMTAMISLWLKPLGERQVETLLGDQDNLTEFDLLVPGRFQTLASGKRVTYTEGISGEGELARVFINEYKEAAGNEPRNAVTVIADSGRTQVDGAGRRFLVLKDGQRYQGTPGQKNYQTIEYEEYGQLVDSGAAIQAKKRRTAIPTSELFGATDARAVSELQWRIGVVLLIPIIALLAIPLARVNPRQGRFTRLVPAMILCFFCIVALSGARTALEKGDLPLDLGLWWIHGLALITTFFMYRLDWLGAKINKLPALLRS
jgi:lipopolysaccharide export system permease protein